MTVGAGGGVSRGPSLVLVATPIGNLGDLSSRAADVLRTARLVCCEDTRRTGRLLHHAGITAVRLLRVDDHTEGAATERVLDVLGDGGDVALVSDAGTPGISDPGERLVRSVVKAGHLVTTVPGPSAAVAALVISGLPTARWVFEGFLPRAGRSRADRLMEISAEGRTTVIYEAPHRVARTMRDLEATCGPDRRVAIARELTKLHEETWRGSLQEALVHLNGREPRGEYVVVLEGAPAPEPLDDQAVEEALRHEIAAGADRTTAVAAVARHSGRPRREVYRLSLGL